MKMCKSQVVTAFISKHFLPIGTIFIICIGILIPAPAVYLNGKLPVVQMCIITLFFVIGTKFRLTEIKSALNCYKEIALGIFVVLFLTPVFGTKLLMLPKFRELPRSNLHAANITSNNSWSIELPDFGPEEFRIGLQIFCVSPCASAFPTVVVRFLICNITCNAIRPFHYISSACSIYMYTKPVHFKCLLDAINCMRLLLLFSKHA